ncbi:DUF6114 domain-containing protein [Streptomyces sp. NBC_01591]|uniref:DUF6114 domain-containing protein n=1 Tax=Streptomyces sp. NBC_01591 TaxID=2975888 RepID=UPI002DDA4598|nr:DUF6114 domain-containing protein [Streptomyces sp. NBC_01591]WSD70934.1 DUF6114 domain-containing protein [Streptomyces sp. NBC_01591]
MSPESTGQNEHYLRVFWRRFRTWRGNRPFWAGLFTMMGGLPIAYFPYANMHLGNVTLAMSTTAGAGSLIIGILLVTLGLTMWFHHIVRVFAGVAAILLALISIPVANIGGFLVGFLFALLGGALSVSWAPGEPKPDLVPVGAAGEKSVPSGPGQESGSEFHSSAAVPQQQPEQYDTTVEVDGGRHRAG